MSFEVQENQNSAARKATVIIKSDLRGDILFTRIKEIKFTIELDKYLDKEIKKRLFK